MEEQLVSESLIRIYTAKENRICIKLRVNFLILIALEKNEVQEVDSTGLS